MIMCIFMYIEVKIGEIKPIYSIGWSGAEWQSLAAGGGWGRMITDLSSHFSQDNNY